MSFHGSESHRRLHVQEDRSRDRPPGRAARRACARHGERGGRTRSHVVGLAGTASLLHHAGGRVSPERQVPPAPDAPPKQPSPTPPGRRCYPAKHCPRWTPTPHHMGRLHGKRKCSSGTNIRPSGIALGGRTGFSPPRAAQRLLELRCCCSPAGDRRRLSPPPTFLLRWCRSPECIGSAPLQRQPSSSPAIF